MEDIEEIEERIEAIEDAIRECSFFLRACERFVDVEGTVIGIKNELFYLLKQEQKLAQEMHSKRQAERMREYYSMI